QFSVKIIGLIINVFLARILSPEAFGLIAMLTVFIALGTSLMDSGLTSSLIRSRITGQKDYSTIFIFNLIGGIAAYLILCAFAPFITDFYSQSILIKIIPVYRFTFMMNALVSIQNTLLIRALHFKQHALIQIPAVIAGGTLGVLLAYYGYGVWSLVWMQLLSTLVSTILHWIQSPWPPR